MPVERSRTHGFNRSHSGRVPPYVISPRGGSLVPPYDPSDPTAWSGNSASFGSMPNDGPALPHDQSVLAAPRYWQEFNYSAPTESAASGDIGHFPLPGPEDLYTDASNMMSSQGYYGTSTAENVGAAGSTDFGQFAEAGQQRFLDGGMSVTPGSDYFANTNFSGNFKADPSAPEDVWSGLEPGSFLADENAASFTIEHGMPQVRVTPAEGKHAAYGSNQARDHSSSYGHLPIKNHFTDNQFCPPMDSLATQQQSFGGTQSLGTDFGPKGVAAFDADDPAYNTLRYTHGDYLKADFGGNDPSAVLSDYTATHPMPHVGLQQGHQPVKQQTHLAPFSQTPYGLNPIVGFQAITSVQAVDNTAASHGDVDLRTRHPLSDRAREDIQAFCRSLTFDDWFSSVCGKYTNPSSRTPRYARLKYVLTKAADLRSHDGSQFVQWHNIPTHNFDDMILQGQDAFAQAKTRPGSGYGRSVDAIKSLRTADAFAESVSRGISVQIVQQFVDTVESFFARSPRAERRIPLDEERLVSHMSAPWSADLKVEFRRLDQASRAHLTPLLATTANADADANASDNADVEREARTGQSTVPQTDQHSYSALNQMYMNQPSAESGQPLSQESGNRIMMQSRLRQYTDYLTECSRNLRKPSGRLGADGPMCQAAVQRAFDSDLMDPEKAEGWWRLNTKRFDHITLAALTEFEAVKSNPTSVYSRALNDLHTLEDARTLARVEAQEYSRVTVDAVLNELNTLRDIHRPLRRESLNPIELSLSLELPWFDFEWNEFKKIVDRQKREEIGSHSDAAGAIGYHQGLPD
ncbi:hypothetical protein I317_00831 [Kwoniella heveanensis CBS 569]|nr:hypothetical protein I317_00831 [Kwoniella heveanensis CBS 569]